MNANKHRKRYFADPEEAAEFLPAGNRLGRSCMYCAREFRPNEHVLYRRDVGPKGPFACGPCASHCPACGKPGSALVPGRPSLGVCAEGCGA